MPDCESPFTVHVVVKRTCATQQISCTESLLGAGMVRDTCVTEEQSLYHSVSAIRNRCLKVDETFRAEALYHATLRLPG